MNHGRNLRWALVACVLTYALYALSENTVDVDLWGHVIFGQRMLTLGAVERAEPFSWSAVGHTWVNHEVLAELALGAAHRAGGGGGILLLKLAVGLATFLAALGLALSRTEKALRPIIWGVGALALHPLGFGFAARPQIFTALALVALLALLRLATARALRWALLIPLLLVVWVNTHGGALAGLVLLCAAAAAELIALWGLPRRLFHLEARPATLAVGLCGIVVLGGVALTVNPWGLQLPLWLIESVSWSRPEVQEWNPASLGVENLPFFILLAASVVALLVTRHPRAAWEGAVLLLLGIMAVRHVRHTTLFAVAALALAGPAMAELLARLTGLTVNLRQRFSRRPWCIGLTVLLLAGAAGNVAATLWLGKEHPGTMEVPRDQYPAEAITFMQAHDLHGDLLVFFDWGEMTLWELPRTSPSIDGRLDTCYPRAVIEANWTLYNGQIPPPERLDIKTADLALLPVWLAGARSLADACGWRAVYVDDLAVVLVREREAFPALEGLILPVVGTRAATTGSDRFPDGVAERAVVLP